MPKKQSKVIELKERRTVVVIDKNSKEELAVVKFTTKKSSNSTELEGYKKGNKKTTYFGHFVETSDNEGKPITVDGVKFKEKGSNYDLSSTQVKQVQNKVYSHVKQAKGNKEKIQKLKK